MVTKAALVRNYLEVYWPCARRISAVSAIGSQLRDPIHSGLTQWRMAVLNEYMDAAPELGRNPVSKHQIQPAYVPPKRFDNFPPLIGLLMDAHRFGEGGGKLER